MIFELRPAHVARALAALCALPILWTFAVEGITTTTEYDYSTGRSVLVERPGLSDRKRRDLDRPRDRICRRCLVSGEASASVGPGRGARAAGQTAAGITQPRRVKVLYRFRSPARRRLLGTVWPTISSATAAARMLASRSIPVAMPMSSSM